MHYMQVCQLSTWALLYHWASYSMGLGTMGVIQREYKLEIIEVLSMLNLDMKAVFVTIIVYLTKPK